MRVVKALCDWYIGAGIDVRIEGASAKSRKLARATGMATGPLRDDRLAMILEPLPDVRPDMRPLTKAQVYQLWEIVGGHPDSAGLVANPQGGRAMPLPPPRSKVAITIEPAGGSRQPTTKPIVVLQPRQV